MSVIGPRNSAVRHLLGETVTKDDVLTDTSPFGVWSGNEPLDTRPPELWIDQVCDAVGGDW